MSDTVSFIVKLPTRPEKREQMRAMLFGIADSMASEPDFINTWIHEDLNDPDTLVLYESWACSREYFIEHHLAAPYRTSYEAALPHLLSAPRTIDFLKSIRAYPTRLIAA